MTGSSENLLPLLAALLLPGAEMERLLGRAPPGLAGVAAAERAAGREAMLRRLDRATGPGWTSLRRRAAEVSRDERPRLAELLRRLADGRPPRGASPLLLRLARERLLAQGDAEGR